MKQFYMDTNVFMSRFKPDDPYFEEARSIVEGMEKGELQAETSVLTLLEAASVSGRLYESRRGDGRKKKIFVVGMLMRLATLRIRFVNIAGDSPIPVKGINASLPSIFNESILLSLQCSLKTLDLIHLAAGRHAKRMNSELDAFVTGDKGFLSNKKELSGIIGMPVLSPKEYVESFGM
ncbi:MAG: type II toxin-antitoxin system VapC family toxin [Nitrososphaerales archaeon]